MYVCFYVVSLIGEYKNSGGSIHKKNAFFFLSKCGLKCYIWTPMSDIELPERDLFVAKVTAKKFFDAKNIQWFHKIPRGRFFYIVALGREGTCTVEKLKLTCNKDNWLHLIFRNKFWCLSDNELSGGISWSLWHGENSG